MKKKIKLLRVILIIGVLLILCLSAFAQTEEDELINSYRLTDSILIVGTGEMEMDMVAAVNTEKGIVIIDSGISPSLTANHRSVIEKAFGRSDFKYVINTHHHGDHVYGNQVFKDAVIIAHENAVKWMLEESTAEEIAADVKRTRETIERRKRVLETLDKHSMTYKKLKERIYVNEMMCDDFETIFQMTPPELTFTDQLTLDMGDLNIELVYFGPGFHSDNDIIVSIPEENTVFTGDILYETDRYHPVNKKSNIDSWVACLDYIFQDNEDVKNTVSYHDRVLPGSSLKNFHHTLKSFRNERLQKKCAVDSLRAMISVSGVPRAVKQFEDQFLHNKDDAYFIWEGDLLSLTDEYRKNEYDDEAIMILKTGEKIFPNSTRILDRQAAIYTKQMKRKLAIEAYRKMLRIDPTNWYYAELIYKLENSP